MADTKRSALTALTGVNLSGSDLVAVTDVSDTTMAASGTDKKMTIDEWRIGAQTPRFVVKSADQSNSSNTTLADVTDLSWTIAATGIYLFEFVIFTVSAATTTGLVLAVNGPASPDYLRYFAHTPTSATATFHGGATAYDTAIIATGTTSTTVPSGAYLHGYLDNGANGGTLTLRMRSEISASNATIQQGSWGRLTRLS